MQLFSNIFVTCRGGANSPSTATSWSIKVSNPKANVTIMKLECLNQHTWPLCHVINTNVTIMKLACLNQHAWKLKDWCKLVIFQFTVNSLIVFHITQTSHTSTNKNAATRFSKLCSKCFVFKASELIKCAYADQTMQSYH